MSNDKFEWTDELVSKYGEYYRRRQGGSFESWGKDILEQFKQEQLKSKRNWEVACFTNISSSKNWWRNKYGVYTNSPLSEGLNEEWFLNKPDEYKIHSVKRLSDGEVFCRQDIIVGGKICHFNLHKNDLIVIVLSWSGNKEIRGLSPSINDIQKLKRRLFKTYDGVELFVGDRFYVAMGDRIHCHYSNESDVGKWVDAITFSTQEAAEEHILINKPMLSVEDVLALDVNIDLKMSKAEANRAGMDDGDDCCVIPNKDLIQLAKDKMNKK